LPSFFSSWLKARFRGGGGLSPIGEDCEPDKNNAKKLSLPPLFLARFIYINYEDFAGGNLPDELVGHIGHKGVT